MNKDIRKLESWTTEALSTQWDNVAASRDAQLRSGKDVSFESVLKPTIISLAKVSNANSVLDAGCSSGVLTELLADQFATVVGVDMSAVNIALATSSATRRANIHYVSNTIEKFSLSSTECFSLVVANMVFQDTGDLQGCLSALASRCAPRATLVATITHPWFWPTYWKYDKEPWFKYGEEQAIEAPFKISTDLAPTGLTTHFHRPLSFYLNAFEKFGFQLKEMLEPVPSVEIQKQYPSIWLFPRFLAFRCQFDPN